MSHSPSTTLWVILLLFTASPIKIAFADTITPCNHFTDGSFTSGSEWDCPTVSKTFFPLVNGAGGSILYVDQGTPGDNNNILYLMYDYTAGSSVAASFFDVFFEVVPNEAAYLVRIQASGFLAFERPIGSVAPLDGNGSFSIDPNTSGWIALSTNDLALAHFQGAMGLGSSPDMQTAHPMAEFQLSINQDPSHPGLYEPSPAFWSASVKPGGGADPPISSGIFVLHPDGITTVTPVLSPDGGPVMQGSALPEPATLLLFAPALTLLIAHAKRRSKMLGRSAG